MQIQHLIAPNVSLVTEGEKEISMEKGEYQIYASGPHFSSPIPFGRKHAALAGLQHLDPAHVLQRLEDPFLQLRLCHERLHAHLRSTREIPERGVPREDLDAKLDLVA